MSAWLKTVEGEYLNTEHIERLRIDSKKMNEWRIQAILPNGIVRVVKDGLPDYKTAEAAMKDIVTYTQNNEVVINDCRS